MSAPGTTVPGDQYHATLDMRDARERQYRERIAELEAALRPFAEMASKNVNDGDDARGACRIVMSNRQMIGAMVALGWPAPSLQDDN